MSATYEQFIAEKVVRASSCGFDWPCTDEGLPRGDKHLFDWQKKILSDACERGKSAVFADCGMGKTAIQVMWADAVSRHTGGGRVLIVAPLAVAPQTVREAASFGKDVVQVRSELETKHAAGTVFVTNYEMLDKFDTESYTGVVLDESSILKSFTGKTKRKIISAFAATPYRLACTATPSPNDLMELLNHAEFLGVMRSSEALSEWFIAEQGQSGNYRLKRHAERDFWRWVASWATAASRPSDVGDYSNEGFELPKLIETDVVVSVDQTEGAQGALFRDISMSATGFQREKVRTLAARCAKSAEIANDADGQVVVWCYRNDEADELVRLIPGAVEVRGSDSIEDKESAVMGFVDGKFKVLISKPQMFGYGLNLQNCHECVFCGMDYSYEGYYQAVRRFYRFGQESDVHVWRVLGDTELNILSTIGRKADMHKRMTESIASSMRDASRGGDRFTVGARADGVEVADWMKA